MNLLDLKNVKTFYGELQVLFGVSLDVRQNEVVALLGRNGVGKTTTLKTIAGVLDAREGEVLLEGVDLNGKDPEDVALSGVQLVPEDRRIFGTLTVEENIRLAMVTSKDPWAIEELYQWFPRLKERARSKGKELSGGEQQMLAIGRALVRRPKLILLDEPFEGLAPVIVEELVERCGELAREKGFSFVIVEQNLAAALKLADRCFILADGVIVYEGKPDELLAAEDVINKYLGV